MSNSQDPNDLRYHYGRVIRLALNTIAVTTTLLFLVLAVMVNYDGIRQYFADKAAQKAEAEKAAAAAESGSQPAVASKGGFWIAPDVNSITDPGKKIMVSYGRELIAHTSKYLGPNGTVMQISNGMNCQNCHLDAGTKVFGNNYGSVASLYPKFRPRSGSIEDIYKRVNDCFQRSLNGQALDTLGKEMQAIKAYIEFLGSNIPKGEKAEGSGFKDLAFLDRAADPAKGKQVYLAKCVSCHQPDGQGTLLADKSEYSFPPLWGPSSYNDAAGLFRVSNFAKYVKYNMPLGATHENTQLTDEEAWDVAAFVNSQPRPHKNVPQDWPDISKKPIDHPFGPYADKFSETQHKFGPFKPIQEERKKAETAGKNKGKTS